MADAAHRKATLRVLRLLARTAARVGSAAGGDVLLDGGDRGVIAVRAEIVEDLMTRDLIAISGEVATITVAGRHCRHGARIASSRDGKRPPSVPQTIPIVNREIELADIAGPDGTVMVALNVAESPLAMLARRRGRDGRPFLAQTEWRAGERFRADYTRGLMMPRVGANWEAAVSSGRRASGGGGVELTDAALAARFRIEKALDAVGPELSGVLVDVCCFLKGLELVESERGWPVRSAKVILKAALAALARHYNPQAARGCKPAHPLHWGAEGYRPKMVADRAARED